MKKSVILFNDIIIITIVSLYYMKKINILNLFSCIIMLSFIKMIISLEKKTKTKHKLHKIRILNICLLKKIESSRK